MDFSKGDLSGIFSKLRKTAQTQFGTQDVDIKKQKPNKNETLFDKMLKENEAADDLYNGMISLSNNNKSENLATTLNIEPNILTLNNQNSVVNKISPKTKYSEIELLNAGKEFKIATQEYQESINNRILRFSYNIGSSTLYENLTYDTLTSGKLGNCRLINSNGDVVVKSLSDIPKAEITIPIYAIMQTNEDGESTLVTETEKTADKVSTTIVTTTDPSAKLPDGQEYILYSHKTVMQQRPQAADGYYYSDDGRRYIINADLSNTEYFQNALRDYTLMLQTEENIVIKNSDGNEIGKQTAWGTTPWQGIAGIKDVLNTEDDALAESKYENKMNELKDKLTEYHNIAKANIDTAKANELKAEYAEKLVNKIQDVLYTKDDALAEADYENKYAELEYEAFIDFLTGN